MRHRFAERAARRSVAALVALLFAMMLSIQAGAVTITYWDWHEPRLTLTREFAERYMQENPQVQIDLSVQSGDYLDKLQVAIAAGAPPTISQVHNEWAGRLVDAWEPYPRALFPRDQLRQDYILFDMTSTVNNEVYFLPLGIMNGAIYYNKNILSASGIDEPPLDWGSFIDVAARLTRMQGDGTYSQGGLGVLGDFMWLWTDLVYQNGGTLFTDSGVTFASDPYQQGAETLVSIANRDVDVPGVSFNGGNQAMRYVWTWFEATARQLDFDYGVSLLPTPTGDSFPARGRNNVELGVSVPRNISDDEKDEAFRFIHWLFNNDEYVVRLNVLLGTIPSRAEFWSREEIVSSPAMQVLSQQAPYTVFPGPVESWYWDLLSETTERLKQGEAISGILEDAQRRGDAQFAETPFASAEHLYVPPAQ